MRLMVLMFDALFMCCTYWNNTVLILDLILYRSKFKCALTGKYIGQFHDMLKKIYFKLPVVVI